MFDVDADLAALDGAGPGLGAQRHQGRRSRFQPGLSGVKAYIREINHGIANTHLQHGLKKHPFA